VPRRWYFVDALPRNATGKVVKDELKRSLGDVLSDADAGTDG
jgi:acyl-coenzyme A synthetase/AMP-(fatty) acid ligase